MDSTAYTNQTFPPYCQWRLEKGAWSFHSVSSNKHTRRRSTLCFQEPAAPGCKLQLDCQGLEHKRFDAEPSEDRVIYYAVPLNHFHIALCGCDAYSNISLWCPDWAALHTLSIFAFVMWSGEVIWKKTGKNLYAKKAHIYFFVCEQGICKYPHTQLWPTLFSLLFFIFVIF